MSLHAELCATGSTQRAQLLQKARAGAAATMLSMTLGGAAIAAEAGEVQAGEGPDLLTTVLFTATIAALVILTVGVSLPATQSVCVVRTHSALQSPTPLSLPSAQRAHLVSPN